MGKIYRQFPRRRLPLRNLPFVVQTHTSSNGGPAPSGADTFTNNIAAGNAVLVAIQNNASTNRVTSVTDGLGNQYYKVGEFIASTTGIYLSLWAAVDVVGGACTVTANFNTSVSYDMHLLEVKNLRGPVGNLLDVQSAGDEANSATLTSTGITTNFNDDFIIALAGNASAVSTLSAGAGYSDFLTTSTTTSHFATEDKVQFNAASGVTASFTQSIAAQGAIVVFALRSGFMDSPRTNVGQWKHPTNLPQRRSYVKRQQPWPMREVPIVIFATTQQTIGAKANIASLASGVVSSWKQPTNQPYPHFKKRIQRQQPYPGTKYPYPPNITTTQTIGAKANIQALVTVDVEAYKHPVEQPSLYHKKKVQRQQPMPIRRAPLPPSSTTLQTIGAKANIQSIANTNDASWKQPTNQPTPYYKRKIWRQQPYPGKRYPFPPNVTTVQTIGAVANIQSLATGDPATWVHQTNQPTPHYRRKVARQQPYPGKKYPFPPSITSVQTIGAVANIRALVTIDVEAYKHPTEQPSLYHRRKIARQQPWPGKKYPFPPTSTTVQTIGAIANIAALPAGEPSVWKHPTNQPSLYHKKKIQRQQPMPTSRRWFLVTSASQQLINAKANITGTTTQTIGAVANIRALVTIDAAAWKHPTNQPSLHHKRKIARQMPPPRRSWFLVTVTTTQTIGAKANIAGTTLQTITAKANIVSIAGFNDAVWKHPTNQPSLYHKKKIARQMPPPRRSWFLVTVTSTQTIGAIARITAITTQTIGAKANIRNNPNTDVELWKQPVSQPVRAHYKRLARFQPRRVWLPAIVTTSQQLTAKANIFGTSTQTVGAKANIIQGFVQNGSSNSSTWVTRVQIANEGFVPEGGGEQAGWNINQQDSTQVFVNNSGAQSYWSSTQKP